MPAFAGMTMGEKLISLSAAILGYLLGSIPFGLVLSKKFGYGDIRQIGSGNIGATNVLRTGNKGLALAVLLFDAGKGAFAIFLYYAFKSSMVSAGEEVIIHQPVVLTIGLFAIIGHMFPVWLRFKGGKGVATTLGVLLAAAPAVGGTACAVWLATAALFRYSSLAALAAIFVTPAAAHLIYGDANLTGVCAVITLLVWFKHRANIQRLVKGEEPKIGKKK